MKFYNYLIEGYLRSEYKIGFELEACYRGSDISKVHDYFKKHWSIGGVLDDDPSIKPEYDEDLAYTKWEDLYGEGSEGGTWTYSGLEWRTSSELEEKLRDYLKSSFKYTGGLDKNDPGYKNDYQNEFEQKLSMYIDECENNKRWAPNVSLRDYLDQLKKSSIAFEYSTNPFNITPKNIDMMIKMLSKLNQNNIYTNESCGFHVHVSFPYLKDTDLFWIICNIAVNDDVRNTLLHFKKYDFFDAYQYAKPQFLDDIKTLIKNKNIDSLKKIYSEEKYRVFRIHPQGTLEWRGPRNFLNAGNLRDIKDFIKLLFKFVSLTNNFIDSKVIKSGDTVLTRKEFDSMFKTGSIIKIKKAKKSNKFTDRTDVAKLVSNNFNWVLDAKTYLADIDVEGGDLVWKGGTWIDGNWEGGVWERGEWHKGNWENGTWKYGVWENGTWENGIWKVGTWKSGIWYKGTWKNGVWESGTWKNGTWHKGYWENGTWKYGTWIDGNWENGTWENGIWKEGTWYEGIWKDGAWEKGTWKYGTWENGIWKNGTWRSGVWKNGIWKNGIWYDGIWKDGTWETGKWKGGKWIKGYIKTKYGDLKSTKSPKEYNEYINKNPKATKEDLERYLR